MTIGHDGSLRIDRGLVRHEHRKRLAPQGSGEESPETAESPGANRLPQALLRDLAAYRQGAAQAEIAAHPAIAVDLLTFTAASALLGLGQRCTAGPDVIFQRQRPKPGIAASEASASEDMARRLPLDWLNCPDEAERFHAFRALTEEKKRAILAYCVAVTLKPKLAPAAPDRITAYDVALSLTGGDVGRSWRPAQATYFRRITRHALLAIGASLFGQRWAEKRHAAKKPQLVAQLAEAFAAPEKHGRTPEQVEQLRSWLPEGMAFGLDAVIAAEEFTAQQAA